MGKADFGGLESFVRIFEQLLAGETVTACSIAADLNLGHAGGARRLKMLAGLKDAIVGEGKEQSVRLPPLLRQPAVGDGAVAAACLVSSLATALRETRMQRQVERLRKEWVERSRRSDVARDLDRKFWFVTRGGETALPKAETRLADVIEALLGEREIRFDYVHFNGDREKGIQAQALTLALHEHQFYVIARRPDRRPHPYRFARIANLRVGKRAEYPDEGTYNPRQLFRHVFGIFIGQPDEPVQHLKLRFSAKWGSYIPSHCWHESQIASPPNADGTIDVELNVRVCHELRSWILGFGADVEVLEPKKLRGEIRDAHARAAGLYRTKEKPGLVAAEPRHPRRTRPTPSTTRRVAVKQ